MNKQTATTDKLNFAQVKIVWPVQEDEICGVDCELVAETTRIRSGDAQDPKYSIIKLTERKSSGRVYGQWKSLCKIQRAIIDGDTWTFVQRKDGTVPCFWHSNVLDVCQI